MAGGGAIFGLLGGIASAGGSMMSGNTRAEAAHAEARAQAEGDVFNAKQHLETYFEGMTKSFQTDTAMTQQLGSTLANIDAIRGASGADISSPSGDAISNRTLALGNQDIARETLNISQQARRHLEASNFYMKSAYTAIEAGNIAAKGARMQGLGGAISGIFGGLGGLFK